VPHEFRNLQNLPHEALTQILVGSAAFAIVLLCGIGYLVWRDKKRKGPDKPPGKRVRKAPRRRRRH